ncbi:MAG: hypothetical protein PWP31_1689 [Clostridia bacterium]|nr:hypothetical protein [Clostridia bacterium]MDK2901721.1 hypothetical protein [Thermosediminibacterales bacterium]
MARITIETGRHGMVIVRIPYDPELLAKIKTIQGRCWNLTEKYWTVPHKQGIVQVLLNLFAPEPVGIDSKLQYMEGGK